MSTKATKQNIRVSRYGAQEVSELPPEALCADGQFPWAASVSPEDGAWVLFIPKDASRTPDLWVRIGTDDGSDGEELYAPAGSEEHLAFLAESARL